MDENVLNKIRKRCFPLDTLLLCTPYEKKNSRDLDGMLSEEEFNTEMFSKPRYESEINKIDEQILEKSNSTSDKERRYVKTLYIQKSQLLQIAKEVYDFENMLVKCHLSKSLAILTAYPGSGKTTYLHNFAFKHKDEIKCVFFDFTNHKEDLNLFGKDIKIRIFNKSIDMHNTGYKFISMLLACIDNLLFIKNLRNEYNWVNYVYVEKYKKYLSEISSSFFARFDEKLADSKIHTEFDGLFNCFANYSNSPGIEIKSYKEFADSVIKFFSDRLNLDEMNTERIIIFLLKCITIINICSLENTIFLERKYHYLYIFDNIEYYINGDAIYDDDVITINRALTTFASHSDQFLCDGMVKGNYIFNSHFQLLISIRNTTNFLKFSKQDEDFITNQLDITDIFEIEDIHKKKHDFFKEKAILSLEQQDIYDTLKRVLSDNTIYSNSSAKVIEEMYNQNKRRTTRYLCNILSDEKKRKEYNTFRDIIDEMDGSEKTKKDSFKNASRSYIIRLILSDIQQTGYFSELLAVGKDNAIGKSFARRIMTYLYLKKQADKNTYIGFYSLIKDVFESPCDYSVSNLDELCNSVARILVKMNDPDMDRTKWCQLVIIKYTKKHYVDQEVLANELKEAYINQNDNIAECGVMITNAGIAYYKLLPHFEYFACRYVPDSMPLYSKDNLISNSSSKPKLSDFGCCRIIRTVKEQTFKCIEEIYNQDVAFFASTGSRSEGKSDFKLMYEGGYLIESKPHVLNILLSHIGYLDNFRGYILLLADADGENHQKLHIGKENKLMLNNFIIGILNDYINKLDEYAQKDDGQNNKYIQVNTIQQKVNIFRNKLNMEYEKRLNKDIVFHSIFE